MKLIDRDHQITLTNSASSVNHELAEKLCDEAGIFAEAAKVQEATASEDDDRNLLTRLKRFFDELGITRLSRITGLDTVDIPVWAAVRPNARTLSVSQGKGRTDTRAAISAVMECFELAICERQHPRAFLSSLSDVSANGPPIIALHRYLRPGEALPMAGDRLTWVEGLDLVAGRAISLPEELVRLDDQPNIEARRLFWQSSDGIGAGKTLTEAVLHGLCECVERDALALASFRKPIEVLAKEIAPAPLSEDLGWAVERITSAGQQLRLFDITSDVKVPCFLALIAPTGSAGDRLKYIDLASGTGAHPNAARAAFRAVTEAAQTRLTTIAGARDDFDPGEFRRRLPKDLEVYLQPSRLPEAIPALSEPEPARHPADDLAWSLARLRDAGIASASVVSFQTEPEYGVSLVKVLVPDLESDPRSKTRRLGRRALAAMLGAR